MLKQCTLTSLPTFCNTVIQTLTHRQDPVPSFPFPLVNGTYRPAGEPLQKLLMGENIQSHASYPFSSAISTKVLGGRDGRKPQKAREGADQEMWEMDKGDAAMLVDPNYHVGHPFRLRCHFAEPLSALLLSSLQVSAKWHLSGSVESAAHIISGLSDVWKTHSDLSIRRESVPGSPAGKWPQHVLQQCAK